MPANRVPRFFRATILPGLTRFTRGVLLSWCLLLAAPAAAAPLDVVVVVSNDAGPYAEMAQGIAAGLNRTGVGKSRVVTLDALARLDGASPSVIVAVGLRAAETVAALDTPVPVLNALIPRVAYEKIARLRKSKNNSSAFSAIYLDQPIARQLDLIDLLMPSSRRIGVVLGPDSADVGDALTVEARARGFTLATARISKESELPAALQSVLGESGVLLSLPDAVAFNSRTLQSVLFTAYQYRTPVIGFSPAYVRAGALAAVHSTPTQLARQVSDILQRFNPASPSLPPPQYPEYFSVSVNEHVARSLEIKIESEEALAVKLQTPRAKP